MRGYVDELVLLDAGEAYGPDLHETFAIGAFQGINAAGPWTLEVRDRAAQDTGILDSWSLTVLTN